MTKDEALKMAIEALDTLMMEKGSVYQQAVNACKEALEQPAQEPVAWIGNYEHTSSLAFQKEALKDAKEIKSLYTHPHQWQRLTDDEIGKLFDAVMANDKASTEFFGIDFARAIEQALKNKNNG